MKQKMIKQAVLTALVLGMATQAMAADTNSQTVVAPLVANVSDTQEVELTLDKAVQMALDYNRDIKIARGQLKEAEWAVGEASAGKMPTISYGFQATRGSSSASVLGETAAARAMRESVDNRYSQSASVTLPIYTGGAVEGQIDVARYQKESAKQGVLSAEELAKLNAVSGYYTLLESQNLYDVAKESVTNLQGHVDNVQAQYNVGVVAKLDVLTSQVSLADAKASEISAANAVAVSEASLNQILGLPLQTKLKLVNTKMPFDAFTVSLQDAWDYAMQHRPEVLQADFAVKQAKEQVGIAASGTMPTVAVGAGNDWSSMHWNKDYNDDWTVYGKVSFNLWDGGATHNKVGGARAAVKVAEEQAAKTKESVQLEVKQAYLNISSAAERVRATQTAVAQAEESFKIATVRYRAGVGINLDVLDAQLALNQAQTNYIQALYDYNVGLATLEKAIGVPVNQNIEDAIKKQKNNA